MPYRYDRDLLESLRGDLVAVLLTLIVLIAFALIANYGASEAGENVRVSTGIAQHVWRTVSFLLAWCVISFIAGAIFILYRFWTKAYDVCKSRRFRLE